MVQWDLSFVKHQNDNPKPQDVWKIWYWTWDEIKRFYNTSDIKLVRMSTFASSLRAYESFNSCLNTKYMLEDFSLQFTVTPDSIVVICSFNLCLSLNISGYLLKALLIKNILFHRICIFYTTYFKTILNTLEKQTNISCLYLHQNLWKYKSKMTYVMH